jgi:hypothetical protein
MPSTRRYRKKEQEREDEDEDVSSYYMTKEKRRYRNLKQETMDRTVWKIRFGKGYRPVARQTTQ